MVDLTVEPRFIDVIKKLLRCEGVKYTTAIIDLQVTNLVYNLLTMMALLRTLSIFQMLCVPVI